MRQCTTDFFCAVRECVLGLAVALAATLAAAYLAEHYGPPLTLMALLVGLALNFLGADARLTPGLTIASRTLLRWGIVLLGARVTCRQLLALGLPAFTAILAIIAVTIGVAVILARRLGFTRAYGVLAGGSVAICGASAALAFASLLGEQRLERTQLPLTLVGVSMASALAMFVYPILARHWGFTDQQAGFMFGAAVHDVAQSLGAGYAFSPVAGQIATIVKLARVALLAPAMTVVALFFPTANNRGARPAFLPWFIVGFFALVAVNSAGLIPAGVANVAQYLGTGSIACAVAATGIRSPLNALLLNGSRSLLVIAGASLAALLLSMAAARWLLH